MGKCREYQVHFVANQRQTGSDDSLGAASGNIFAEMWAEIQGGLAALVYGSNKNG